MGANPFVFWDGMGLDRPGSGIYSHCVQLYPLIKKLGVEPLLVGTADQLSRFPVGGGIEVPRAEGFRPFQDTKLLWPPRVERKLLELVAQKNVDPRQVILHGFANVNLSVKADGHEGFKRVITVHDLIPLVAKKFISMSHYKQFKFAIPRVVEVADAVIAVSSWTAEALKHLFPHAASKIYMIPNGFPPVDPEQNFQTEALKTGSKLHLLTVSRYEKYKRLELLVEILTKKANDYRWTLVTDVKGKEWAEKNAAGLIKMGALRVLHGLGDDELRREYREARLLVHPSLYEGFCLPAAEALASGTPVIYTGGSGIDETVGPEVGFALSAQHDVFDWIKVIEGSATLKETQKFKLDLADRMNAAATWSDSADKIVALYRAL